MIFLLLKFQEMLFLSKIFPQNDNVWLAHEVDVVVKYRTVNFLFETTLIYPALRVAFGGIWLLFSPE